MGTHGGLPSGRVVDAIVEHDVDQIGGCLGTNGRQCAHLHQSSTISIQTMTGLAVFNATPSPMPDAQPMDPT